MSATCHRRRRSGDQTGDRDDGDTTSEWCSLLRIRCLPSRSSRSGPVETGFQGRGRVHNETLVVGPGWIRCVTRPRQTSPVATSCPAARMMSSPARSSVLRRTRTSPVASETRDPAKNPDAVVVEEQVPSLSRAAAGEPESNHERSRAVRGRAKPPAAGAADAHAVPGHSGGRSHGRGRGDACTDDRDGNGRCRRSPEHGVNEHTSHAEQRRLEALG